MKDGEGMLNSEGRVTAWEIGMRDMGERSYGDLWMPDCWIMDGLSGRGPHERRAVNMGYSVVGFWGLS